MIAYFNTVTKLFGKKEQSLFLVILTSLFIMSSLYLRVQHFNDPILNWTNYRQTQTAMITKNLEADNFNFLYPRTNMDGNKIQYKIFEFPIYNFLVAFSHKYARFFTLEQWGKIISLIFFLGTIILYYNFLRIYLDIKVSTISTIVFLSSPMYIFHSQSFMPESILLFFALMALFFGVRISRKFSIIEVFLLTIALTFCAIIKIHSTFWIFLFLAHIFFLHKGRLYFSGFHKYLCILIPVFFFIVWFSHLTSINKESLKYIDPNSPQGSAFSLVLSSLSDILSLDSWIKFILYVMIFLLGLPISIALLFSLLNLKWSVIPREFNVLTLYSLFYLTLMFYTLATHPYYSLILLPIISTVIGMTIANFLISFHALKNAVLISLIMMAAAYNHVITSYFYHQDKVTLEVSRELKERTNGNDLIFLYANHWKYTAQPYYPSIFYQADRKGWNFPTTKEEIDDSVLYEYKLKGAKYFVTTQYDYDSEHWLIRRTFFSHRPTRVLKVKTHYKKISDGGFYQIYDLQGMN